MRTSVHWTAAEDAEVRRLYGTPAGLTALRASLPGRTLKALRVRALRLGVAAPQVRWTPAEDALVRELYPHRRRRRAQLIAALPGRTLGAIQFRSQTLGVQPARTHWTAAEDKILRLEWTEIAERSLREKLPGRSRQAIWYRVRQLGLDRGVPQGYEPIHAACVRTGFARPALLRILAAADDARIFRVKGRRGGPKRFHRQYVETFAVDAAVAAWLTSEVVAAAARVRGVGQTALREWLVAAGAMTRAGKHHHVRVPSATIDAVVEARRPRAKRAA